jgi:hypothetical protein
LRFWFTLAHAANIVIQVKEIIGIICRLNRGQSLIVGAIRFHGPCGGVVAMLLTYAAPAGVSIVHTAPTRRRLSSRHRCQLAWTNVISRVPQRRHDVDGHRVTAP